VSEQSSSMQKVFNVMPLSFTVDSAKRVFGEEHSSAKLLVNGKT